jgi:hypothetical protein
MLFTALSEWATLDQLCCPFLTLSLELQDDEGPMWVNARGNDGFKEFLRTELGILNAPFDRLSLIFGPQLSA